MSTLPTNRMPRGTRWVLAAVAFAASVALGLVVAAMTGGASDVWGGYTQALQRLTGEPWWTLWVLPGALVGLLVATGIILTPRASEPGPLRRRHMMFLWSGVGVGVLALCSPIGTLAQGGVLTSHMFQHVLLGALAPVLILLGVSPAPYGTRQPRRVLAVLLHPVVAFAIWLSSTILWLLPDVHHQVLVQPVLWVVQQVAVFLAGIALWAPITGRIVHPPAWFRTGAKSAELIVVWFVGIGLANFLWFSGTPLYGSHAAGAAALGISPLQDQANAGTVMVLAHCAITFVAIGILFFRHAAERGLEQRLIEAGLPAVEVKEASLHGSLHDLAKRSGVAVATRTGLD